MLKVELSLGHRFPCNDVPREMLLHCFGCTQFHLQRYQWVLPGTRGFCLQSLVCNLLIWFDVILILLSSQPFRRWIMAIRRGNDAGVMRPTTATLYGVVISPPHVSPALVLEAILMAPEAFGRIAGTIGVPGQDLASSCRSAAQVPAVTCSASTSHHSRISYQSS